MHEGFLRLAEQEGLNGATRGQFFAYVGQVLRSVVIDHPRNEGRTKRGGDQIMVTLSSAADVPSAMGSAADLMAVDRALTRMSELNHALYELLDEALALEPSQRKTWPTGVRWPWPPATVEKQRWPCAVGSMCSACSPKPAMLNSTSLAATP